MSSECSIEKVDLCIGGGSFKGISFIGALEYITKTRKIKINNFYGCSIGSIIGILYIIGVKPLEMLDYIVDMDLKEYWDLNLNNISESYSILGNKVFDYFKTVFKKYENGNITFKEFYDKYSININISTVCLSSREHVLFSYKTHPDICVFEAIRASCSIPLLFPATQINKEYYVDGCLKNMSGCAEEYIDGYTIVLNQSDRPKIDTLYNYSCELMITLTGSKRPKSKFVIELKNLNNSVDFSKIGHSDKIKLYYSGIKETQRILDNK